MKTVDQRIASFNAPEHTVHHWASSFQVELKMKSLRNMSKSPIKMEHISVFYLGLLTLIYRFIYFTITVTMS